MTTDLNQIEAVIADELRKALDRDGERHGCRYRDANPPMIRLRVVEDVAARCYRQGWRDRDNLRSGFRLSKGDGD